MGDNKLMTYEVEKNIKKYVEVVLRRRGFYVFEAEDNKIMTDASNKLFDKAVIRAKCEKRADDVKLPRYMMYIDDSEDKAKIIQELGINEFCNRLYPNGYVVEIKVE